MRSSKKFSADAHNTVAAPRRVLVIKPSSLGDIVQSLPVLAALRPAWRHTRVDWLVKSEWAGLLEDHPLIDKLLLLPSGLRHWPGLIRQLRNRRYDMVLDLQGLLRSGLLSRVTGAPLRAGFANGREGSPWCYTRRVAVAGDSMHAVERYLELVRALGISGADAVTFPLPLWHREEQWLESFLAEHGAAAKHFCVIHPAARWKTKQWPADRYAELGDWLAASQGFQIFLIGGRAQAGQVHAVMARMREHAVNLAGATSLPQLGVLLRKASMLITNDSGPMHLAAAVGTPVVAIFGPTDPRKVGPFGPGHVVLKKSWDCSRCGRNRCTQELACLRAISSADVQKAVETLLHKSLLPSQV